MLLNISYFFPLVSTEFTEGGKCFFNIVKEGDTVTFATEDETERTLWVQAIYRATGQTHKPVPPVMQTNKISNTQISRMQGGKQFFFFLHFIWNTFYNLNELNQFLLCSGTNMFCLKVFLHLPLRSRMWFQSRQKHLRYDLYYKATTRRLHWAKHASLLCIHLPGKILWHYQEESSLDCSWAYQMPTEGCKTQPTVSWWYDQSGPLQWWHDSLLQSAMT